ncbi:hypothetical protein SELMODRAFT_438299 [Selaginella moellendorffii]|uniref:H15 domain-containing protein n=1 Tax=Selaginella moellendorffii TaxID=88036 RepID=D8QVV9_SELML|nr:histone H1 [Selaginella moellendorffii]EFJ36127.1 hypothetical protein SELMODRAFT_438299 [Selaginella moellendorffii]|eukprot:XP_002962664.1 histone H1 [Selaginella moellendorffii]
MAVAVEAVGEATTAKPNRKPSRAKQASAKDQAKPDEQKIVAPVKKDPKPKSSKNTSIHHPPYVEMVMEAISFLKERTGSSQHAIAKYLVEKYSSGLPTSFKRMLSIQLKSLSNSGKITKVKNSFKLPSSASSKSSSRKPAPARVVVKVPKASSSSPAKKVKVIKPSSRAPRPSKESTSRAPKPRAPAPKSRDVKATRTTRATGRSSRPAVTKKITTPSKPKKVVTPAKRAKRVAAK